MLNPKKMPPKPKELYIYVNGEWLPNSQAKISVMDHGLLYGDGCFDAWMGMNGFIYQLDPHLDRLYRSVHSLQLDLRMSKKEMREKIIESVQKNALVDFYIKTVVTRGISPHPVIDPAKCEKASVIIYARPKIQTEVTDEVKARGVRIKVLSIRRVPRYSLEPKVKSLNYLNIVMGKLEARVSGFDEAVMLDDEGYICECPGFNIEAISGNKLMAPKNDILMGITRDTVIQMCRDEGMEIDEGFFTVYDFVNADEVLLSNSVSGIAPVTQIDGWKIGTGKPGKYGLKFQEIYLNWLKTGVNGTQCFPEAWED
ncbi:MAG: aminotransferase class IV [Spirochaetota bacterium]|nr:MAG: aminotransferase class IV [Spirochaetota bacterium]